MADQAARKPMKYYIDFENVHGFGLKGVENLGEDDHVLVFYSQAAETFHIEQAIALLTSKATIQFIEVEGGTRNALDFQLVAALFGTISDDYEYAIISADGGFDAAIKMGEQLGLAKIVRMVNIQGDAELPTKSRSRRSRSSRSTTKESAAAESSSESAGAKGQTPSSSTGERTKRRSSKTVRTQAEPAHDEGKDARDVPGDADGASAKAQADAAPESPRADAGVEAHGGKARGGKGHAEAAASESEDAKRDDPERAGAEGNADIEGLIDANGEDRPNNIGKDRANGEERANANADASSEGPASADAGANGEDRPSDNDDGHANGNGNGRSRRRGSRGSRGSGKSGKREAVASLLAANGIEVNQQQLSTIMQALNGVKGRQDFYRRIIQLERQEKGLALYRQVRDYYEPLQEITKA